MVDNFHSRYHSPNAFCGNAGPEELAHLKELISRLSDDELKLLVKRSGITFLTDENKLTREDYENVVDEINRETFYAEYKKIIESRE
jgi:hypothetical protein